MNAVRHSVLPAAVVLLGLTTSAWAGAPAGRPLQPTGQAFGVPVSAQTLAGNRGGHVYQLGEAQLSAQLYDNQAAGNVTGDNLVTQQAFSGASGLPTVIQNSGNNVIIQNATVLNVQMR